MAEEKKAPAKKAPAKKQVARKKKVAKKKKTSGFKVNVYSIEGEVKHQVDLPPVFKSDYRPDLIRRAVKASRIPASYQTSTFPMFASATPPCAGEVRTMIACARSKARPSACAGGREGRGNPICEPAAGRVSFCRPGATAVQ